MYSICGTKKLRDRLKQPIGDPVATPSTVLGNWYATALFWKPQAALLVNERTLLPVFMPLAPAGTVAARFPEQLEQVAIGLGVPSEFLTAEVAAMREVSFAKTANRSVVGSMNEFAFLADVHRSHGETDLVALSIRLAATPCSPLYGSQTSPDRELEALVADLMAD